MSRRDKEKVTLSLDPEIKEAAKQRYNLSEQLEKHLENLLTNGGNKEARINRLNEKIEEKKNKINELQKQISNHQTEKETLKKELEQEQAIEQQRKEFFSLAKSKIQENKWTDPEDIPFYWRDELGEKPEELWEAAKHSDVEPQQPSKL